ncbi:MAG: hypothetical protein ABIO80_04620 [Sphingomicrobium sp.]
MGNKPFTMLAVVVFAAMAVAHAYRLATHFQIIIGSHPMSELISIVGGLVAAILAVMVYRESRR